MWGPTLYEEIRRWLLKRLPPRLGGAHELNERNHGTIERTDAGNHNLVQQTGLTATIFANPLTASIAAASSNYGSTITPGQAQLSGVLGSDQVTTSTVSLVSSTYTGNNVNAGSYKQSITSTLSDADAANYSLVNGFTTSTNNYTANQFTVQGGTTTQQNNRAASQINTAALRSITAASQSNSTATQSDTTAAQSNRTTTEADVTVTQSNPFNTQVDTGTTPRNTDIEQSGAVATQSSGFATQIDAFTTQTNNSTAHI